MMQGYQTVPISIPDLDYLINNYSIVRRCSGVFLQDRRALRMRDHVPDRWRDVDL